MTDVGYAHLSEAEARNYGHYVAVQAIDGDAEQLCSLPLSEGRLPQNSHEIVLYSLFRERPCSPTNPARLDHRSRWTWALVAPLSQTAATRKGCRITWTELRLLRPAGRK